MQVFATPLGLDARDLPAFAAELLQVVPARHSPMARAEDSLVAAVHIRLLSAVRASSVRCQAPVSVQGRGHVCAKPTARSMCAPHPQQCYQA